MAETDVAPEQNPSPAPDPSFRLGAIGQIAVTALDLERAIAFYRDVLGLPFLFRVPALAFFDCQGLRLMLSVPERPELDHPSSILYFNVPDIGVAHASLTARDVSFQDAPHLIARLSDVDVWMAFCTDSEGNTLGLMSEVPHG
jgi:methylmalonyl-CoA/ethylmalonyl-CoA epimerase